MTMFFTRHKTTLLEPAEALPGRDAAIPVPDAPRRPRHADEAAVPRRARDGRLRPRLLLGRRARVLAGAGRLHHRRRLRGRRRRRTRPTRRCAPRAPTTPRPCSSSSTPQQTSYEALLKLFWENHDPTQGMRQGNDAGTQYRSAIYATTPEQRDAAAASRDAFQARARGAGLRRDHHRDRRGAPFYYAEGYHQQYLAKNPNGYCGLGGTGVSCPIGTGVASARAGAERGGTPPLRRALHELREAAGARLLALRARDPVHGGAPVVPRAPAKSAAARRDPPPDRPRTRAAASGRSPSKE